MVKLSDYVQINTNIVNAPVYPSVIGGSWYVKPCSYSNDEITADSYIAQRMQKLRMALINQPPMVSAVTLSMIHNMMAELDSYDKAYVPSIHRDYWRYVLLTWYHDINHQGFI